MYRRVGYVSKNSRNTARVKVNMNSTGLCAGGCCGRTCGMPSCTARCCPLSGLLNKFAMRGKIPIGAIVH